MKPISTNDIKMEFKKSQKIALVITVLCSAFTLICTKGFFADGDYLDADGFYVFALYLLMICSLFFICCLTPLHIKNEINTPEEQQVDIISRLFALWLSICLNLTAQSGLYLFFSVISPAFTSGVFEILLYLIIMSLIAFVWIIFCTFIYLLAKQSIAWYVIGFITVNVAPMIIVSVCNDICRDSTLAVYDAHDYLIANPFIAVVRIIKPLESVWLIGAIVIVAVLVILIDKNSVKEKLVNVINFGYKYIISVLISISAGSIVFSGLSSGELSFSQILPTSIVAILTGAILSLFAFGKKSGLKLCAVVLLIAALLSGAFIGLPILSRANEYNLPDIDRVESIAFRLGTGEQVQTTENFDEILSVNSDLIELFKKGYAPEDIDSFPTPDCLADCWQELTITYKLKNGKSIYREYRDLIAPEFDAVFIKLAKSEVYLSSMRNTDMYSPKIECYLNGEKILYEPSKEATRELINVYCDELSKADTSDFYQKTASIRISGIYESDACCLYVPLTFNETRSLVWEQYIQYTNTY